MMDDREIRLKKAKEIGKELSSIRLRLGISREKLAEQSNISSNYLYEIEIGKKVPNVIIFSNICSALGVTTDDILNPLHSSQVNRFFYDISNDFSKLSSKDKKLLKNTIHFLASENDRTSNRA